MPKILIFIILFLAITLVIFSFSELQDVVETLQRANALFVSLAVLVEFAWYLLLGWIFQSIYELLGLRESIRRLTLLATAATFAGVVTGSTAVGGLAVLVADGRKRGHPSGRVTVAGALYVLFDEVAFLCVLALGIIVLIRRRHFDAPQITASLFLLASACAIAFLLYLGYRAPEALGNMLARSAHVLNTLVRPFVHREYISEERARGYATDFSAGIRSLPEKPRSLIQPFLLSLCNKGLMMAVLVCSFLSFDVPFTIGVIVGGFAITYLFAIVTPTPSGVGLVEGVMALALATLGVDFSQAVIITLTFRAVTFWLPLAAGAVAFRALALETSPESSAPV